MLGIDLWFIDSWDAVDKIYILVDEIVVKVD